MLPKTHVIVIEEPSMNLFTALNLVLGFHDGRVRNFAGVKFPESLLEMKNDYVRWSIHKENWYTIGEALLERLKTGEHDPAYVSAQSLHWGTSAHRYMDKLENTHLSKQSNTELLEIVNTLWDHMCEMNLYGVIPVGTDMEHFVLSKALEKTVKDRIEEHHLNLSAGECVSVLTSPDKETLATKQKIALLEVAVALAGKTDQPATTSQLLAIIEKDTALSKQFDQIVKQFYWLQYGYQGPAWDKVRFAEELLELLSKQNCAEELKLLQTRSSRLQKQHAELEKTLHFDAWDKKLFQTARDYLYLKGYRIDVGSRANFWYDSIFAEVTKRFPELTLADLHYSTIDEVRYLLDQGNMPTTKETRQNRRSHCVYYVNESAKGFVYGKEAEQLFEQTVQFDEVADQLAEVHGQVASAGQAVGHVKLVYRVKDLGKVEKGHILVANATVPDD